MCIRDRSSSIQATLIGRYGQSDYGKSKLAGEELFFTYAQDTGAKVLVYRFPNLFGKWCRPNYNSAAVSYTHLFDMVVSGMALVVLAIPFLFVAVLQKLSSPNEPVFFRQKRVGQDSHVFYIVKFRTMKSTAPKYSSTGNLQNADSYISKLGRFLRDTSIDELPQLFNVLVGDMSLIGPRPLIRQERSVHFLRRYYGCLLYTSFVRVK